MAIRPTACGCCIDELQRLPLQAEPRVAQVRQRRGGRLLGLGGLDLLAGPRLRPLVGAAAGGAVHLGAGLVDLDADHAGELAGERLHLGAVADRGDQLGGLAQRVDPAVGPIEVVAVDHVAEHEAVQRHPAGDQLADGRVALLEPQVARVQAVRLDRDVGLGGEVLVALERPQRRLLPGRVAVEGEDHLAAELVVVEQQPPQHPAWSSPNAVPQVATAVGTPARWQAITSV